MSLLNMLGGMAAGLITDRAAKYSNPMIENLFSQDPAPIEDRSTQAIPAQMQDVPTLGVVPEASMPPVSGYDLPPMPSGDMEINLPDFFAPEDDIGILAAQYDLNPGYVESALAEGMTIPDLREAAQLSDALYDGQKRLAILKLKKAQGEDTSEDESMLSKIGGGLKNFFGSEKGMLSMALAFNTLRNKPDNQLAAGIQDRLKTMSEQETLNLQTNKIVQSLTSQGTPASLKYARMIAANPSMAEEIYKEYINQSGRGNLSYSKEQLTEMGKLRDDLRKDLGMFTDVEDAYQRVLTLYENPSDVSDYGLAVSFAKILDPGSVAREGEVAAVQKSGAITKSMKQALINAINGTGALPPQMRDSIVALSQKFFEPQARKAVTAVDLYKKTAAKSGIALEDILMRDMPTMDYQKPNMPKLVIPATAQGFEEEYKKMTAQERAEYDNLPPEKQQELWSLANVVE